jgi:hypothetical protein
MEKNIIKINSEISKANREITQLKFDLDRHKTDYRKAIVDECVEELMKIKNEEGELNERALKIYIGNLSLDVKNLYLDKN